MRRDPGDRGDIVLGWITKIVVLFGVAGLVLFDAISIGSTYVTMSDQGAYAAREASETWQREKGDVNQAFAAAQQAAESQNALNEIDPDSFVVDPDGTAHVTITREASTVLVHRIGAIRDWATLTRTASGRSVG